MTACYAVAHTRLSARLGPLEVTNPMRPEVGTQQTVRFATFEVDLQVGELRKHGVKLKLGGQPFQSPSTSNTS
jgi:hypothetical protein